MADHHARPRPGDMTDAPHDPLILGRQIRRYRKLAGLTLDQVAGRVGKPAPYLSLLENGKREPRLNLIIALAAALDVDIAALLDRSAPTRRDALEISLIKAQETALFESLGLPAIKPSARLDTETLTHLVGLHNALRERSNLESAGSDDVRRANGAVHRLLADNDGYLEAVEEVARDALVASGYAGEGPFTSRNLLDLTAWAGYELTPIDDMPGYARSIIDTEQRRVYIAQRDELRTRQARKAVLQTLAGFLLGHESGPDVDTFLRQRLETAYLAAAILAPEEAVVPRLTTAKQNHDIDVEDVSELFYVSYEMGAWRVANLLTRRFGVRSHLIVNDEIGVIVKGYSNDGVPVGRDEHGGMETQRLCRHWGGRKIFESRDRFNTRRQYTDTPTGTFFCVTQVETGRESPRAISLGAPFAEARWFRGRETDNREASTCPDPACCREPSPDLEARWGDSVVVSARSQARILGMLAHDPYPELDMPEVLALVDAHSKD